MSQIGSEPNYEKKQLMSRRSSGRNTPQFSMMNTKLSPLFQNSSIGKYAKQNGGGNNPGGSKIRRKYSQRRIAIETDTSPRRVGIGRKMSMQPILEEEELHHFEHRKSLIYLKPLDVEIVKKHRNFNVSLLGSPLISPLLKSHRVKNTESGEDSGKKPPQVLKSPSFNSKHKNNLGMGVSPFKNIKLNHIARSFEENGKSLLLFPSMDTIEVNSSSKNTDGEARTLKFNGKTIKAGNSGKQEHNSISERK